MDAPRPSPVLTGFTGAVFELFAVCAIERPWRFINVAADESQNTARRSSPYRRTRKAAWSHSGRVRADQKNPRSRAELHRAWNFLGHVERTLLIQKFAKRAEKISDYRAKHLGQSRRRERGRCRYWRWLGSRVQDGESQSSKRHRAVPRRRDRRGRNYSRHFYNGRTPGVLSELAALWADHGCKFEIPNSKIENRREPEIVHGRRLRYCALR